MREGVGANERIFTWKYGHRIHILERSSDSSEQLDWRGKGGLVCILVRFSFSLYQVIAWCPLQSAKGLTTVFPSLHQSALPTPRTEEEASPVSMTTMCPRGSRLFAKGLLRAGGGVVSEEKSHLISFFPAQFSYLCLSFIMSLHNAVTESHTPKTLFRKQRATRQGIF